MIRPIRFFYLSFLPGAAPPMRGYMVFLI